MSRLAIEVKSGVFVADVGARVKDKLWERIVSEWNLNAIMIFTTNTEQSYGIRVNGDPDRNVIDFDGISLLSKPVKKKKSNDVAE
ncbi:MAG: type I-E CRISPR-associated endoribonuclease Cas2e [Spirochaetes bacterium]|jgi:CRISPR-associated protein Cas2|nr:type I-E CRISPR-associated endoribonuclease Cas2e [Spirochaetota bacterium]